MRDEDALKLLEKKLEDRVDIRDAPDLARGLANMPLALAQAVAYMARPGGRCSVGTYPEELRKSDNRRRSSLMKTLATFDAIGRLGARFPDVADSFEHVTNPQRREPSCCR